MLDTNRVAGGAAYVRRDRGAGRELDNPIMQWTGDALVEHDALRQRPAFMRAAVTQGKYLVGRGAKHGHVALGSMHDACAQARDILDRADLDPTGFENGGVFHDYADAGMALKSF